MGKLQGPLKITGSVGGLTFTAGEDGAIYVKEKSGPRACRMKDGEEFARSRRAAAEFKLATSALRVFRLAMGDLKKGVEERHLTGRMTAWFLSGIESDTVNTWGERRVQDSDTSLLEDFEFNRKRALDDLLPVKPVNCWVAEGDRVRISIPGFRLRRASRKVPEMATHFRVVSALLYTNFDKKTYSTHLQAGELTKVGRKSGAAFVAEYVVEPATGQMAFWLLGIEFYKLDGEKPVVVRGGVLRCMRVWSAGASRTI